MTYEHVSFFIIKNQVTFHNFNSIVGMMVNFSCELEYGYKPLYELFLHSEKNTLEFYYYRL